MWLHSFHFKWLLPYYFHYVPHMVQFTFHSSEKSCNEKNTVKNIYIKTHINNEISFCIDLGGYLILWHSDCFVFHHLCLKQTDRGNHLFLIEMREACVLSSKFTAEQKWLKPFQRIEYWELQQKPVRWCSCPILMFACFFSVMWWWCHSSVRPWWSSLQ